MDTPKRSPRQIGDELSRLAAQSDVDRLSLLHELHVYREELTAQNEELMRTQAVLEESRDRFIDLYDFAPNGYVTLDRNGIILQINLPGATLLGKERGTIEGMPLLSFVRAEHRSRLLDFLRRCRTYQKGSELLADLTIATGGGARDVQLMCTLHRDVVRSEYFTTMIDVTERRRLEAARDAAAREHATLASRLISIQDEERQRIARDLHDNVGQLVTALRLSLDVLGLSSEDAVVRKQVGQARGIVEKLDKQLDFMTGELRPVVLDLGAVSAIGQFVEEWSNTFGVSAQFDCDGVEDIRLKPEIETHLYRVVQEALNNVSKHAAARRVRVQLARRDAQLVLTISDDGRGFQVPGGTRPDGRGLGLVNMRERAQIVNGAIEVQSTPGQGTTVILKLPVASSLAQTG